MTDVFRRLHAALPQVLTWVDRLLEEHAEAATPVAQLAFARLPQYWPADVLRAARVVRGGLVPFPPVSAFGLPEFAAMESMPMAGVTFRNMIFVDAAHDSEGVHFHELVHVVQWNALGASDFLLAYGVGLAQFGYENSPLEAVAYDLQASFERAATIPNIRYAIAAHAFRAREAAAGVLAQHGVTWAPNKPLQPTSGAPR
jgi:hypothetical protein